MNLQEFCIELQLPITRVSRIVRGKVLQILQKELNIWNGEYALGDGFCISIDHLGLSVSCGPSQSRFNYLVFDERLLHNAILEETKNTLLRPRDIQTLIDAAKTAFNIYHGKNKNWTLVNVHGQRVVPAPDYWDKVEKVLGAVGAL